MQSALRFVNRPGPLILAGTFILGALSFLMLQIAPVSRCHRGNDSDGWLVKNTDRSSLAYLQTARITIALHAIVGVVGIGAAVALRKHGSDGLITLQLILHVLNLLHLLIILARSHILERSYQTIYLPV